MELCALLRSEAGPSNAGSAAGSNLSIDTDPQLLEGGFAASVVVRSFSR